MSEHDETEPHIHALTAFMVVIDQQGEVWAVMQPPAGVCVDVAPTQTHVLRASRELVANLEAQTVAQFVTAAMAAQAAAQTPPGTQSLIAEALAARGISPDRS